MNSHGEVSLDLWFQVFLAEAAAIVLVIAILVLSGMVAWSCLMNLFDRRSKGNRVR